MTTKTMILGAAAVALLSITACNREPAATSEGATSADSAAIDAVATTSEGETATSPSASAAAPRKASTNTPASPTSGAAETMTTGGDRAVVSADSIAEPASTQEQIAITRETLSPAGASSGPTAPRPQN